MVRAQLSIATIADYDPLDVAYLRDGVLEVAGLPLSEAQRERKWLMVTCEGRYFGCEPRSQYPRLPSAPDKFGLRAAPLDATADHIPLFVRSWPADHACAVVAVMSSDAHVNPLDRRNLLCGGGALVFSAMLASLLGASKPVRAQTIVGGVPEVDRLSIRVVIDTSSPWPPARRWGARRFQHFGWPLSGDKPPRRTLISEFGLSMHAESKRGSETRHLLMDFGYHARSARQQYRSVGH